MDSIEAKLSESPAAPAYTTNTSAVVHYQAVASSFLRAESWQKTSAGFWLAKAW